MKNFKEKKLYKLCIDQNINLKNISHKFSSFIYIFLSLGEYGLKEMRNDSGVNFKSYSSRQKFFNSTMSMMVVIIDTMYNKIIMYYHGITDPSVFTFDQMKKNAKTEATDILAMMKNYAQGMAPRF